MMLDETSTVNYLAVAFATRHDRSRFFVVCAHGCYSLGCISSFAPLLDLERAHKRVSVVGEVQVHPVHCLFDAQETNCTGRMAIPHARMP